MTIHTILNFLYTTVFETASAFIAQEVKRAVTEKAIKAIPFRLGMAREVFAITVTKKLETVFYDH